ncbi:conserved hypothetical protein [Rippkaea orientalis PCC 8801]|uniref:Sulfotransferase domain-containing protein n=1 Tax=Rippkaea orientalis (strain PCC 8801 / RF-1) TaxID=41431 RepID=B7K4B9_RIPO1|nr:hypothetical protein [Rippkaea orientalis]ACK67825.1 conserved hypothetical protein [Rippkaea orientalis PCC 8801]
MYQKSILSKLVVLLYDPVTAFHRFQRGSLVHYIQDSLRELTQINNSSSVVNQKEIRVIGLRRTGNHAIIQWLAQQQSGIIWTLNNLPVNENPYRHRYEYPEKSDPPSLVQSLRTEAWGNFTPKDCIIYSYEDYSLEKVVSEQFEAKHDLYLGPSLERYDVLILRDPFNLFASRLKSEKIPVKHQGKTMADLWIEYAKEFLNETQYLKDNRKICINYNKWFCEEEYRREIAHQLELNFSNKGVNTVSHYGGGSSFDSKQFQGKANKMKVLERWQNFIDNPSYHKLISNKELIDYSERIFGYLPGTEIFYKSIQ